MTQIDEIQVAASQLLNALTGGTHDEMLSSRAWRMGQVSRRWGYVRKAIDFIFFWQTNHCQQMAIWEAENT